MHACASPLLAEAVSQALSSATALREGHADT